MRTLITALALSALLALLFATAEQRVAAQAPAAVRVGAVEFAFQPDKLTLTRGLVVFDVENKGVIEHNFVLLGADDKPLAEISVIAPGATERTQVRLGAGTYTYICSLPGHKEAGMAGTASVP